MAASALEKKLKKIVRAHPDVLVREPRNVGPPYSPSGPIVRAVLFCDPDEKLRGQVVWSTDYSPARWVVQAIYEQAPDSTLTVEHPASEEEIPGAITRVIERVLAVEPLLVTTAQLRGGWTT